MSGSNTKPAAPATPPAPPLTDDQVNGADSMFGLLPEPRPVTKALGGNHK